MKIVFWLSLAGILYTYAGYPIVMWILAPVATAALEDGLNQPKRECRTRRA